MGDSVVVVWDGDRAVPHDPAAPLLRADDGAVLRGDGVFETLRVHDGRVFLLDEHLTRLARSAAALALAVPPARAWRELATTAAELFHAGQAKTGARDAGSRDAGGDASGGDDASAGGGAKAGAGASCWDGRLRLTATRGPAGGAPVAYALLEPVPASVEAARARGVDALSLSLGVTAAGRGDAPWLLPGAKHLSYAVPMAAQRFAEAAGAGEALWVSTEGEVLEGATSSLVVVLDGRAYTPPTAELGLLAGTTVAALARLAEKAGVPGGIGERRLGADELRAADEAMFVSSIRGVAPLVRLDGAPLGTGAVGPLGAALRDLFEQAVHRGGLD
ncbi:aminotransferase class IV [Frankia sp. CNm7]|uniref:Aminotransferase class IV n=1 Tax=Frankia nepalensis TaxID=1836974 RepID=A0A937UUR1_9ACTN|nr:aminotransferase class IV [Frankia nepalensis]MBL7496004.1 aminotransferase class IV [Frankia nepalensis]MBL7514946.1 aminotransferase class IV [Frankia nepalensis]MBL7524504.1 aminotransferase class IV [Frankia nepalensis]MBL7631441.1 aminotransferase class IV [Frankia nepalensis]